MTEVAAPRPRRQRRLDELDVVNIFAGAATVCIALHLGGVAHARWLWVLSCTALAVAGVAWLARVVATNRHEGGGAWDTDRGLFAVGRAAEEAGKITEVRSPLSRTLRWLLLPILFAVVLASSSPARHYARE